MVKKILYCATVDYHFKAFHLPYMKWFKEQGWQVDVASAGEMDLAYTDNKYNISIKRSPFHHSNLKAYQQLKQIIDQNDYDLIHCHTPLGGVLGRLAGRQARKKGTKIIYTAHGFHFCKGSPKLNWLIYYPIEKYLARFTDLLITINQEDFNLAKKHHFQAEHIVKVNGVGVDTNHFKPIDKLNKLRLKKAFGYKPDDFLLFYAAEFNKNKNHQFLLHSLALIKEKLPNVKLLLAGEGSLLEDSIKLAKQLNIRESVDFLGFRTNIHEILSICDVAVATSLREGLPVNVMEAMSCALPVVAIDNRGHRELVSDSQTGWLLERMDPKVYSNKILILAEVEELTEQFGMNGRKTIIETYSINKVLADLTSIYEFLMDKQEDMLWAAQ